MSSNRKSYSNPHKHYVLVKRILIKIPTSNSEINKYWVIIYYRPKLFVLMWDFYLIHTHQHSFIIDEYPLQQNIMWVWIRSNITQQDT